MTIRSATTFSDGCQDPSAVGFGTVQPGTPAVTATGAAVCRFTFGSTNDTASLRIRQADGSATAMASQEPNWSESRYVERTHTAVDVAPGDANAAWAVDTWGGSQRTIDGTAWARSGNPVAGGTACWGVVAVSASEAWAACDGGNLRRTTNGGTTWGSGGAMGTTQRLRDISKAGSAMWVVGSGSVLRRSTDSGATWTTPAGAGLTGTFWGVEAGSDMVAYIKGDGDRVFKTTDGGANWARVDPPWVGGCDGLHAVSATTVWLACDGGRVEVTTDGGATWQLAQIPDHWAM